MVYDLKTKFYLSLFTITWNISIINFAKHYFDLEKIIEIIMDLVLAKEHVWEVWNILR